MSARFDKQGFTLFEMLAAVAVAMIISVFVFAFSNNLIELIRASESKIGTEIDANMALDIIVRDLEAAVLREGRGVMFAVDAGPKIGEASGQGALIGSHLRFFTASPAFNAVSYQIARRSGFDKSERPRYILFRSVVRKDYTEAADSDIRFIGSESDSSDLGHVGEVVSPNLQSFLLDSVVDFGVRLYIYDSSQNTSKDSPVGLRLIFPSTKDDELDDEVRHHAEMVRENKAGSGFSNCYPDIVEIYIRVLDQTGAAALFEIEENGAEGSIDQVLSEHGRLFSRTVRIISRSI